MVKATMSSVMEGIRNMGIQAGPLWSLSDTKRYLLDYRLPFIADKDPRQLRDSAIPRRIVGVGGLLLMAAVVGAAEFVGPSLPLSS